MKRTFVKYFCDKCGQELPDEPEYYNAPSPDHVLGQPHQAYSARVRVEYTDLNHEIYYDDSILCNKCKVDILKAVLSNLEGKME